MLNKIKKKAARRSKKERDINFFAIISEGAFGIALGVVLLLLPVGNEKLESIVGSIGQLIISVSAGSLLLEWFGYVNYTKKRMCEILSENEVLEVLSTKRKKDLKTAILNNLYMPNKELGENNIVSVIDSEMDNILKDYYYKEYIMYVDINVERVNGKKYIKKVIRKTFCAETINNKACEIEQILETQINPVQGEKTVMLDSLYINGEKETGIVVKTVDNTEDDGNHYDKLFYADVESIRNKLKFDDTISLDMTYTTYTEINDSYFAY